MASSYDADKDPYAGLAPSIIAPARMCRVVVPNDGADLAVYAVSLWAYVPDSVAGGVGTVTVTPVDATDDANTITFSMPPGLVPLPPLQVRRVWATGTSVGITLYTLSQK